MIRIEEHQQKILIITIDRPERRNAVDRQTAEQLAEAFRQFDSTDQYSVAILTGAEGNFCAGADLKAIATGQGNRVALDGDGPMGPTRMFLKKPVIAAVEGYAVAGGVELAIWCDLRVASQEAIFGVHCRRFGVPLVDGGTVRLPRLIGMSRAMDLILTGRNVSAKEALDIGLVNRIAPVGQALEMAIQLACEIAQFPQQCLRNDRQSVHEQWNRSMEDALQEETKLGLSAIYSGETVNGAQQFTQGHGRHGKKLNKT